MTLTGHPLRIASVLLLAIHVASCAQRDRTTHEEPPAFVPSPSLVVENPKRGTVIAWGTDVSIRAAVTDIERPVVEFRANDEVIGRDDSSPYEVTYRPNVHGPLILTAQARDNQRNVIAQDAVTIEVQNPNPSQPVDELTDQDYAVGILGQQPLVTLTTPVDGVVAAGGDVNMAAEASGTASGLVRVEFLINGVPRGVRTLSPPTEAQALVRFNHTWSFAAGTHTIVARAVDAAGRIGSSKPVTISVR